MNNSKVIATVSELEQLLCDTGTDEQVTILATYEGQNETWSLRKYKFHEEDLVILRNPDGCFKCCSWQEIKRERCWRWRDALSLGTVTVTTGPLNAIVVDDSKEHKYGDIGFVRRSSIDVNAVYRYIAEKGVVGERYEFTSYSDYSETNYYFFFDVIELDGRRAYLCAQGDEYDTAKECGIVLSSTVDKDVKALADPPLNVPYPEISVQDDYVSVTLAFKNEIMKGNKKQALTIDEFLIKLDRDYALNSAEYQFSKNIVEEAKRITDKKERKSFLKRLFQGTIGVPNEVIEKLKF
jgi:hypothetical protein